MDADQAIDKGFVDKKAEEALPIAASAFDHKWIRKGPKAGFKSEKSSVDSVKNDLKKKIDERIARK